MAKTRKDEFSQIGYIQVVESGANTLTFNGLSVFSNILEPKGLVIHQIEYDLDENQRNLVIANADSIVYGLTGADDLTAISLDDAQVYDMGRIMGYTIATAAGTSWEDRFSPFIRDFTDLPGGGRLVPADRIYGFVLGGSLAGPVTLNVRFHFTIMDLTAQQYLELAQALRVLT